MTQPIECFFLDYGYDSHQQGPCCYETISGATSFASMHKLDDYKNLKKQFQQGIWPEGRCTYCKNIESSADSQSLSKRQTANIPGAVPVQGNISNLVVDVGRLCNLQCRTCTPALSSSWIPEHNAMPVDVRHGIKINIDYKVHDNNEYNYEEEDFSNLRRVSFLGGEPMYNNKIYNILEKVYADTGGNCEINLITNGTIKFNPEYLSWVNKFKKIVMVLSIDAIGPAAEFIRTGCNWETIESNIESYRKITKEIVFHPTFSPLNLFELPRLFAWGKQSKILMTEELTHVQYPQYMSYQIFTNDEKAHLAEFLKQNNCEFVAPALDNYEYDADLRRRFIVFMEHTKQYHGMDWKTYLPDLYNLLNTTCP